MATIFGVLTNTSMILHTWLRGKHVGTDAFGNKYYTGKARKGRKTERRWVMYQGEPDASAVPPEWHGWLHYQTDDLPQSDNPLRRPWQKPHKPNMTGTSGAYLPPGHTLSGRKRDKATGDYTPWQPPQ